MAKVAGDVVMRIGGDNSGLTRVLSDSSSKLDAFRSNINKGAVSLAKLGAAGAAAGTAIAVAITRDAASAGKEIANLSRVSGAGVVEFQKMAAAAQTVGIEQEKLGDIFKDVRDRVGDFIQTGGGPMADFFERIAPKVGVTAEQFRKLSGPQALQLFVDTMEKAGLSSNEMAFQMEAMASDATALIPLLQNGGSTIRQMGDEAERTGRILSELDVKRLQLAAQQMAEFDQTIGTLKNQLGAELAPILAGIGKLIEDAAIEAGGFGNLVGDAMNTGINAVGFFADAIHGIQVVFQSVADGLIIGFTEIGSHIGQVVGGMMALADAIPGVDLSEQLAQTMQWQQEMAGVGAEAKKSLHDRLMEPLPSESLKRWVGEVRTAADEAAATLDARLQEAVGGEGLTLFGNEEQNKAAEEAAAEHRKQLAARIERIREANLSEIELQNEKYAAEQEALRQAREAGLEIKGGYDEAERESTARHEAALAEIKKRAREKSADMEDNIYRSREAATKGFFGNLSSLMNTESRKMFEIGKAAAIANTVISTWESAGDAAKWGMKIGGPPVAAAFAGAAVAAGFARIQSIRAQSFGGGGSAGGAGGAGTGGAVGQSPGVAIQGQQQQAQQFNITLEDGAMFSAGQVRQLIGQINEQTSENGVVLVTGG